MRARDYARAWNYLTVRYGRYADEALVRQAERDVFAQAAERGIYDIMLKLLCWRMRKSRRQQILVYYLDANRRELTESVQADAEIPCRVVAAARMLRWLERKEK